MIELQDIKLENIKNLEISKPYNLIYLDYNKEEGIKIFKQDDKEKRDIHNLSDDDLKNMYRLYIFNENSMVTVYNFGNEYKYSKIDEKDIDNGIIKYVYLKEKDKKNLVNERLKVRVGILKNSSREVIQYIGYEIANSKNGGEE